MKDGRRRYYDHEAAYRRIAEKGGQGWDDLSPDNGSSYDAIDAFLSSEWCPPPASAPSVLDAGCGGGQVALRLARRGYRVTAIDFSETAIELARRNAEREAASVECLAGDCVDLASQKDGSFDLVIDNHLLHCLIGEDRLAFLRSAHRVLRPGGTLFSDTMCYGPRLAMDAYDIDPATRVTHSRTRFWATREELTEELALAGFQLLHQELRELDDEPNVGRMLLSVARRGPAFG